MRARAITSLDIMSWILRDNLYWCDCGGRAVFLDLKADLYFCLPRESNAAFLRVARHEARSRDTELLEPLVRRGLLARTETPARIPPPETVETPQSDFQPGQRAQISLFAMVRTIFSELWTQRLLRRHGFHQAIERVRRIEPGSITLSEHRSIQALVSASSASALFLRSHDRCLVRGIALHSACRKRGLATKLVLGVVAHPFTAHCWVQLRSTVLVGGFEQARLYTPILVVE
jgi:hypothetical protein